MLEMVYNPTITTALKVINLQLSLIISYVKLLIEFVSVDGLEHLFIYLFILFIHLFILDK